MKILQQFIKKCGSKQAAADKLMISKRYIDMMLAGKKPSKRLERDIKFYLMIE